MCTWTSLIDAPRDELLELERRIACSRMALYCESLQAYLAGDIARLERSHERWVSLLLGEAHPEVLVAEKIVRLRLQIRRRSIDADLVRAFELQIDSMPAEWKGEAAFVCAMAHETLDRPDLSGPLYKRAALLLEELGARRKAVKADLNAIVALSRAEPARKLLAEYDHVYRKAKKIRHRGVAGVALLNVSREYQCIGAHKAALRLCNQALALLRQDVGTLPYFLAIVHRCHLLIELGREPEAEVDLESARLSGHPEVQEAIHVVTALLARKRGSAVPSVHKENLTPTWRSRLENGATSPDRLGELEEKLVSLLASGPKDKFDLIESIYGNALSFEVSENRLKVLLNRLRKKRPGLILFTLGRYRLVDEAARAG